MNANHGSGAESVSANVQGRARRASHCAPARCSLLVVALTAASLPVAANPQSAHANPPAPQLLDRVTVKGPASAQWDRPAPVASRLGLSARETPAAVEILDTQQMQALGLRGSVEALNAMPGILAGQVPSSPGMASMRGFSGGAIALLYDGVRQSAAPMVTRDFDSWSFERIEVLKGPASVLYGEGALAGAINLVPKMPVLGNRFFDSLVGVGSFGSRRYAADFNQPLGQTAAVRAIASHHGGDGWVDATASSVDSAALAWRWQPSDELVLDLALEHFEDTYDTAYWGTPLLPRAIAGDSSTLVDSADGQVLDRSINRRNYNVANALQDARSDWLRGRINWQIGEGLRLSSEASYYDATRRWWNSETYTFNPATALLDRGLTRIEHDQRFWVWRTTLSGDNTWRGHRTRFAAGLEFSESDFAVMRRFGNTTAVDPFAPRRGLADFTDTAANYPGPGNRLDFDSRTRQAALFAELAFNATPRWLLLAGLRHDRIDLARHAEDRNTGTRNRFERAYHPLSWRVGSVFDLTPTAQLYAQYSTAVAPVGSLPLMSLANSRLELTQGRAAEAGVKTTLWQGRMDIGAAAYWILQDDILTRDPRNPQLSVQGGRQSSRGIELSWGLSPIPALRIEASVAALKARFDQLREAGGADRAGNVPANVPERMAQLQLSYRLQSLPFVLGTRVRYVGPWYADNANRMRVAASTVWDASVAYPLAFGEIALHGRNLGNALYADWTGGSASQFVLGAPRSVEMTLKVNL